MFHRSIDLRRFNATFIEGGGVGGGGHRMAGLKSGRERVEGGGGWNGSIQRTSARSTGGQTFRYLFPY